MNVDEKDLQDIMARAGASDTDREAWLRERAQGVTATQARDLMIGKITPRALEEQKKSGVLDADLSYIPVIGWGKEREPVIAEGLRGEGIEPESRVFHHESNSRYLASPDGIGITFDGDVIVSEIKTSGKDMTPGSKDYIDAGYEWQMQWVMFVIGAGRCRFVVEERLESHAAGERATFTAGDESRYWVERDESKIAQLVTVVDAFLEVLDAYDPDSDPDVDEEIDTHAVNYLRGLDLEKQAKALKEPAYRALVEAGVSQESALAKVTFTPGKPGPVTQVHEVDEESAKAARIDLWAKVSGARQRAAKAEEQWAEHLKRFTTTTEKEGRPTPARVTVTAVKQEAKVKG